jgi:circadian clock protein KaiC
VVDSFRTWSAKRRHDGSHLDLQSFMQRLAQFLTSWEATTFLVGEYDEAEIRDNPLFTVADGLFWLWQVTERTPWCGKCRL